MTDSPTHDELRRLLEAASLPYSPGYGMRLYRFRVAAAGAVPGLLDEIEATKWECQRRLESGNKVQGERDALKKSLAAMTKRYEEASAELERLRKRPCAHERARLFLEGDANG